MFLLTASGIPLVHFGQKLKVALEPFAAGFVLLSKNCSIFLSKIPLGELCFAARMPPIDFSALLSTSRL